MSNTVALASLTALVIPVALQQFAVISFPWGFAKRLQTLQKNHAWREAVGENLINEEETAPDIVVLMDSDEE